MSSYKVGDVAEIVVLDISTACIGEYVSVRVKDVQGSDILVHDANGTEVWVTEHHLAAVTD